MKKFGWVLLLIGMGCSAREEDPGLRGRSATSAYDWTQFGGDAQHASNNRLETAIGASTVAGLQSLFRVQLPDIVDSAPLVLTAVQTTTGVRDLLFATTKSRHLVALDAHTGAAVWTRQNGPGACHVNNGSRVCFTTSAPAIDPTRQFVFSYGLDGFVHQYKVADGTEVQGGGWPELTTTKPFDEKGSGALTVLTAKSGASFLYVANGGYPGDAGDYQGHLTSINLGDGTQNVFNTLCSDQPVHFLVMPGTPDCPLVQAAIWARAAVVYQADTDTIYMASGNGHFDPSMNAWGDTVFSLHPDGTGASGRPLDSYTPTNFQALDDTDTDIGSTAPAILPTAAGAPHLAVQSGKDGTLRVINLDDLSGRASVGNTGGELAIQDVPQGGQVLTAIAVWPNALDGQTWIFVANDSGTAGLTVAIDTTGRPSLVPRWQSGVAGTSPLVAGGAVFVAGPRGITALDATSGAQLWQDTHIGRIHWQSPVVANGILYITDQNSRLSAYTLPAQPDLGTANDAGTPDLSSVPDLSFID